MRKKVRRGQKIRNKLSQFNVLYNNLRGYKSKVQSIRRIIEEKDPTILALAETKLCEGEDVKIEGYEIERVDRKEDGGGVLIAYKTCIKNIMSIVKEERENCEILWMKVDNGKTKIKIAVVYMPQENEIKIADLKKIYKQIEEEIMTAQEKKESVLIMGDFNCKVGKEIEGNTEEITKGGKLLLELCNNTGIIIANAEDKCRGKWTRSQGGVKSIIDYVLLWKDDVQYLKSMEIDENLEYTPYSTEGTRIIYSDHYMIDVKFSYWSIFLLFINYHFL